MEIYVHTIDKNSRKYCRDVPGKYKNSITLDEKLLDFEGRRLLVIQDQDEKGILYTVVPGFVQTYKEKCTSQGFRCSEVLEIKENIKRDIGNIIRENGFKGEIRWNQSE